MEQMIYERPREKLRNQGAASLSVVELLQLIISSGSMYVSGAQLAHAIEGLILDGSVSYESIMRLRGMGDAKTCQILAVIELAKRISK